MTSKGSSSPADQRKTSLLNSLAESFPEKASGKKEKKADRGSIGKGIGMAHMTLTNPIQKPLGSEAGHESSDERDTVEQEVCRSNANDRTPSVDKELRSACVLALSTSGALLSTHGAHRASGDSSLGEGDVKICANGRSCSIGDGISDTVSEPSWSSRQHAVTDSSVSPPPTKTTPSKSIHSDMYNTVFALQSLGDGQWSDYLTRARGLWDGHVNKRLSGSGLGGSSCPSKGSAPEIMVLPGLASTGVVGGAAMGSQAAPPAGTLYTTTTTTNTTTLVNGLSLRPP